MVEGPASSDSVMEDEAPAPTEEGSGILGPIVNQETKVSKNVSANCKKILRKYPTSYADLSMICT